MELDEFGDATSENISDGRGKRFIVVTQICWFALTKPWIKASTRDFCTCVLSERFQGRVLGTRLDVRKRDWRALFQPFLSNFILIFKLLRLL
jgi:hypothetical protein